MKSPRCTAVMGLIVPAVIAATVCVRPVGRAAVAAEPSDVAPAAGPSTAPSAVIAADERPLPRRGGFLALPATRPANRPSPFFSGGRVLRLRDIGLAGPVNGLDESPAADDEWEQISQFAATNFPNRWRAFQTLIDRRGADTPIVQAVRDQVTSRYRLLSHIRDTLPDLYDAAVEQGRLEDAAWQAVIDSRRQPNNAALTEQKRQKVGALIKDVLRERQERIDALKQSLKEEQDQLDADVSNVGRLIEDQIANLSGADPSGRLTRESWRGNNGFGGGGPWGGGFGGGRRWEGPGRFQPRDPATRPAASTRVGQE